ncbi:MAG: adenine phosphoribosyltransferase [Gammaproteobacteria bacterium]
MDLKSFIADVPDFPKPGILFRDICPLLANVDAYQSVIDNFLEHYADQKIDVIVGIESRGFIFASSLAYAMKCPLALVRKPGKLPHPIMSHTYELEYGTDTLEIHLNAIKPGARVVVMDDLLATGGTARATCQLIEKMGGVVVEVAAVIELVALQGRKCLDKYPVYCQVSY